MKQLPPILVIPSIVLMVPLRAEAQMPFDSGLIAYYQFNGNVNDVSGNENDGFITNGAISDFKYSFDRFGQPTNSLFLNTIGQPPANSAGTYVVAPTHLDFNKDFTLGLWLNIPGGLGGYHVHSLISDGTDATSMNFRLISNVDANGDTGGHDYLQLVSNQMSGGAGADIHADLPQLRNTWWQAVVVRSGTNVSLFTNGTLAASGLWTSTMVNHPRIEVGSMEVNGGEVYPSYYPMVGGIDDVRMYDRALTAFEVRQLFVYESQMEMNLLRGVQTGPVAFTLTAFAQDLEYRLTRSVTNRSSEATNTSTIFKSTGTNYVMDSQGILTLLANSYNTNFPSGAKLAISGAGSYSFYVVDKTGTNIIRDVTTVLSLNVTASVDSGTGIFTVSKTGAGMKNSGSDMETSTGLADLIYDDTSLNPADGLATNLRLSGILAERLMGNFATGKSSRSISLKGAGAGTIRGANQVLQGTVTATIAWTNPG